jgi:hypothetical protein
MFAVLLQSIDSLEVQSEQQDYCLTVLMLHLTPHTACTNTLHINLYATCYYITHYILLTIHYTG